MNKYPLWKYLLILIVLVVACLYATPNLYVEQPAVEISPALHSSKITPQLAEQIKQRLDKAKLKYQNVNVAEKKIIVRFTDTEIQLQARDEINAELPGSAYSVALNLVPTTPDWLRKINALPMYLGLDLRGGVYFLMQVDMDTAVRQAKERYVSDIKAALREEKIRYLNAKAIAATDEHEGGVEIKFRDAKTRDAALAVVRRQFGELKLDTLERDGTSYLVALLTKKELEKTKSTAIQQNLATLRNRVNELGVAEPIIQRQGDSRIIVQLPGIQDPARAKDILGATATLEYHAVDYEHDVVDAVNGHVPPGSRLYRDRKGNPVLLKKRVIVTGDQVINAGAGFDSKNGSPNVSVTLDDKGARRMGKFTRDNVGKPMAVVYIENKIATVEVNGKLVKKRKRVEEVISVANIVGPFSKRFQTTGLDSPEEARDLALLLRAGALAAPVEIVEERTIGPSLGQDNIDKGKFSVIVGFCVVLVFMVLWYRAFGMVANVALAMNVVMIVAILSLIQATLTLPGIAGIVLTVGMAVDANVLIFERIREELRAGNSPQASISAGYDKALSTIADANITTLIAAVVLFSFGTGPIKGFAITLSIGILTSMFTAIMVTRAIVNLIWGNRRLKGLSI